MSWENREFLFSFPNTCPKSEVRRLQDDLIPNHLDFLCTNDYISFDVRLCARDPRKGSIKATSYRPLNLEV